MISLLSAVLAVATATAMTSHEVEKVYYFSFSSRVPQETDRYLRLEVGRGVAVRFYERFDYVSRRREEGFVLSASSEVSRERFLTSQKTQQLICVAGPHSLWASSSIRDLFQVGTPETPPTDRPHYNLLLPGMGRYQGQSDLVDGLALEKLPSGVVPRTFVHWEYRYRKGEMACYVTPYLYVPRMGIVTTK